MLAELNLGLEDKLHTKVGALSGGRGQTLALLHGYDKSNRVSHP